MWDGLGVNLPFGGPRTSVIALGRVSSKGSVMTQRLQWVPASRKQADPSTSPDIGPRRFGASVSSAGGGVVRLTLSGEIDLAVRGRLRHVVEARLAGEGVSALLIDVAAVTFLDCGGIGVLIAGRHHAADIGCGYRVVNARGIVARVLDLTGVRSFLELPLAGAEGGTAAGKPRRRRGSLG
jgi:anti-sigma B factor antagonist